MHPIIQLIAERNNLSLNPWPSGTIKWDNGFSDFEIWVEGSTLWIVPLDLINPREDPAQIFSLADPQLLEKTAYVLNPRKGLPLSSLANLSCRGCWEPLETKTQGKADGELTWLITGSPLAQS